MSYQEGAIYGTVRYRQAYYGIPLNQTGGALPAYSAGPGLADPLDYQRMRVTWSIPTRGTNVRLVRNSFSVPSDENDGVVLLNQSATAPPVFIDNTLTTLTSGTMLYYTVWVEDSGGAYWRGLDLQAVQPKDWGYLTMLTGLVPEIHLEFDDRIAATIKATPRYLTWNDLAGMTWSQLSPYDWDTVAPVSVVTWGDLSDLSWDQLNGTWEDIQ